jgi:mannose-6-phosphate isomerase-like protein (cupin superfamily)
LTHSRVSNPVDPEGTRMTAAGRVVYLPPGKGGEHAIGEDRFWTKGDRTERPEAFTVIEYRGAAGVPGPPPHVHRSFEEAWYILEGEVKFTSGTEELRATRGAYLYVPRGVPHSFQVQGTADARWVGIFSPGRYVRLLEELGPLIPVRGPPNLTKVRALFAKYDTDLVGAPP